MTLGANLNDMLVVSREVPLGGVRGISVHRTLPQRGLPTVGPWCFVDQFGPTDQAMRVLPHPHTGLQTVTWPLAGEIRHRDSLGSDVVLKPGELNLMTAGTGVSHSEFSVGDETGMHGLQLWVALPDRFRNEPPGFEHLPHLPQLDEAGWTATVMMGQLGGAQSPATTYSPMVGAELRVRQGMVQVPLRPDFEHAILAVSDSCAIDGAYVGHRQMRYLGPGHSDVRVEVSVDSTLLLVGGAPFAEHLVMWWNFIGRSHEDIERARLDWENAAVRFGHVDGHDDVVIPAPPMPQVRLTPRRRAT